MLHSITLTAFEILHTFSRKSLLNNLNIKFNSVTNNSVQKLYLAVLNKKISDQE